MKVLVLHTSALHLGFVGCYGNAWVETPNLDRLAAEGVVFDQHYADTIGSGGPAPPPLPEAVAHVTAAQGSGGDATTLERTLEAAVAAVEGLAAKADWLCWVDLPALQPPWDVPDDFASRYLQEEEAEADDDPFEPLPDPAVGPLDLDDFVLWERLRCTYAGAVTYLDAGLGLLLDELKRQGWFDELLLIVTADRGLALGEHGIVGDARPWLHEEVVHLPLIVRQPHAADAGRRIAALTQPRDVAATLRDVFGVPGTGDGRSLLPLLRGEVDKVRDHVLSHWVMGGEQEAAVRTPEWVLLRGQGDERKALLYAKPEDRWEMNNIVQQHLDLAEELERNLAG